MALEAGGSMTPMVKWQGLSDFFKAKRGEGMSYHTIQAWMALGMPHQRPSTHRLWFDPATCWQEMKYGKAWDAEDAKVSAALDAWEKL